MKYIILDANVYIDMIVSRNNSNKADSYELLKKLLDYDKVRLLLPNIVKTEVERNIGKEVDTIGNKLSSANKYIVDIYWLNHIQEIKNFSEKMKPVKLRLSELNNEFEINKNEYIKEAFEKINNLFEYNNVSLIHETDELISNVQKRKIYKLCPFHIDNKDSFGDALILEILINIKEFIKLEKDDELFFITGNVADFSMDKKGNRELFHPHIVDSLNKNDLINNIKYRTLFTKTLIEDFTAEIQEAEIEADLQALYEEEILNEKIEHDKYYLDSQRKSVGIVSLADEQVFVDEIIESSEIENLMCYFEEKYNGIQSLIENILNDYDVLEEQLRVTDIGILSNNISNYNQNSPFLKIDVENMGDIHEIVWKVKEFINENICSLQDLYEITENSFCNEYFGIGDLLKLKNTKGEEIVITVQGELNPEEYGTDIIELFIKKNDELYKTKSYIEINYGYVEFNEDNGIGDAQDYTIEYKLSNLIENLHEIINHYERELDDISFKLGQLNGIMGFLYCFSRNFKFY